MAKEKTKLVNLDELPLWERPFAGMPHLRDPDQETEDYPGFVVHDGRVTGSITAGYSRLPLWCFVSEMIRKGWSYVQEDRNITEITEDQLTGFIYDLLEQRGDFGRLFCVLADVERQQREIEAKGELLTFSWWYHPETVQRVKDALQRCLDSLNVPPPNLKPMTLEVTRIEFEEDEH